MNLDRSIHTTLDRETYNHLKKLQNDHDITLKQAIKMIVDRNKECDKKLEKKIFQEVVNHVVGLYINSEYFSKN